MTSNPPTIQAEGAAPAEPLGTMRCFKSSLAVASYSTGRLLCCALMGALTITAQAQTQSAAPRGSGSVDTDRTSQPQRSALELYRSGGGSLMRAQLSSLPPSQANSMQSVSFFHVEAPEPRVIQKHDLVTIIIREESSAKTDSSIETSRESTIDAKLEEFIKISNWKLTGGGVTDPIPSIKANANREFEGDGSLDRKDVFIARIQAEVLDVKPNGTLVVQARKRIKTDEEEQFFTLSGICRATDVTADNSVLSTQLFDLELTKSTKGPIRDSTKRGAVHKFFDWLNPF